MVVKGVRFRAHEVVGEVVELALRYAGSGADELVFYDITASPEGRTVDASWIQRVARHLDIPFSVAGGIRSVGDAEAVLGAGAEKVSVNTPALQNPNLIDELSKRFGSQCVVVGIDSERSADATRDWTVHKFTGDPARSASSQRSTLAWIQEAAERGAGEIVLNCMGSDGVQEGYDIAQLRAARAVCPVPLVASGGAGSAAHFVDVFREADVDGALAASIFHRGVLSIQTLKEELARHGIEVRR